MHRCKAAPPVRHRSPMDQQHQAPLTTPRPGLADSRCATPCSGSGLPGQAGPAAPAAQRSDFAVPASAAGSVAGLPEAPAKRTHQPRRAPSPTAVARSSQIGHGSGGPARSMQTVATSPTEAWAVAPASACPSVWARAEVADSDPARYPCGRQTLPAPQVDSAGQSSPARQISTTSCTRRGGSKRRGGAE